MARQARKSITIIYAIIAVVFIGLAFAIGYFSSSSHKASIIKSCEISDKIFVESTGSCREKTISEKFDEKCTNGITFGSTFYPCSTIKRYNLESAYLNDTIVKHGMELYEYGTYQEIQAGKQVGDYCLSAYDTWSHIGEKRCVVFTPEYFARSGNNYFIDEKKDYKNGFVIYMYGNYDWNWFINTYKDKGPILACGTITTYQGHPQIKTTPNGTIVSPKEITDGTYSVYKYTCN